MEGRGLCLRGPTREELEALKGGSPTSVASAPFKSDCAECKFCGVSYLVRSQVRSLDAQLREAKENLAKTQGELEAALARSGNNGEHAKSTITGLSSVSDLGQPQQEAEEYITRDEHFRVVAREQTSAKLRYDELLKREIRRHNSDLVDIKKRHVAELEKERFRGGGNSAMKASLRDFKAQVLHLKSDCDMYRATFLQELQKSKTQLTVAFQRALALELEKKRHAWSRRSHDDASQSEKIRSLEKENAELQRQRRELIEQYEQKLFDIKSLEDRLEQRHEEERKALEHRSAASIKALDEELRDKRALVYTLEATLVRTEKQSSLAEEKAQDTLNRLNSLEKQLEEESKRCRELEVGAREYQSSIASKDAMIDRLQREAGESGNAARMAQSKGTELERQLAEHQHKVGDLSEQLESIKRIHKADMAERDRLAAQRAKGAAKQLQDQLESDRARFESEKIQLIETVKAMRSRLDGALNDAKKYRGEAESCKKRLSLVVNSKDLMQQQLEMFGQKIRAHDELQSSMSRLQKELEYEKQSHLQSRQELETSRAEQVGALHRELEHAKGEVTRLREKHNLLSSKVEDASTRAASSKTELEDALHANKKLGQEKQDFLQEIEHLKAQLASSQQQSKSDIIVQPGVDEEGIEVLEKHMIKLSKLVRQKEAEIMVLQETVHRQCQERTLLMERIDRANNHR